MDKGERTRLQKKFTERKGIDESQEEAHIFNVDEVTTTTTTMKTYPTRKCNCSCPQTFF